MSRSRGSDDAHVTLLKYYTSQCTAQGTYLITIAIGLLAFILTLPFFRFLGLLSRVILLG